MKRSSIVIIGILLALAFTALYVYKKKGKGSTVDSEARNFKLKDTAAITKIFIADKEGSQSTVERTQKGWVVNGKYPCRPDAIAILMAAIRNIEVKMPVPKTARENVLKVMATTATKVEIYAGDKRVKQYYMGHETPDGEGSYMLLSDPDSGENYGEPFVCFIPGFVGYLSPRYIAKETDWRDRVVMNYTPPQMRQIKVSHIENPDSSFTIDLLSTTQFKLKNYAGKEVGFDEFKMKQYLAYFQNLSYEALLTGQHKKLEDSLFKNPPFEVITISRTDLSMDVFKFYHKASVGLIPEHGVTYKYDPDRMYLRFAGDKEWAVVQTYVFGKLFANPFYFMSSTVKK